MEKEKNIMHFYVLCSKLKDTIRTGWKVWGVQKERLESVAEHIFSTQMLAIAMQSEYKYNIDLKKVVMMLALHELEEIVIGDITIFDLEKNDDENFRHLAVQKVIGNLIDKQTIFALVKEFDERQTLDAKFAYWCDKLDCDLQSKLYGESDLVDLNNQKNNHVFCDSRVQYLLKENMRWEEMWLKFGQQRNNYDKNFLAVSNYALKNKIKDQDLCK